jgi:hypothetical protein
MNNLLDMEMLNEEISRRIKSAKKENAGAEQDNISVGNRTQVDNDVSIYFLQARKDFWLHRIVLESERLWCNPSTRRIWSYFGLPYDTLRPAWKRQTYQWIKDAIQLEEVSDETIKILFNVYVEKFEQLTEVLGSRKRRVDFEKSVAKYEHILIALNLASGSVSRTLSEASVDLEGPSVIFYLLQQCPGLLQL